MKLSSRKHDAAPVLSGMAMFAREADSMTRLHLWNRREPARGQDEIAMG